MRDDEITLAHLADKCMRQNSTSHWQKIFKEVSDAQAGKISERNNSLKKLKDGQISLDNFDWSEGGTIRDASSNAHKSIELSPQEQEYKQENDEMFGIAKDEDWLGTKPKEPLKRNPNNPYLTKAEKMQAAHDESGKEIDATEHDGDIEPNPFEKVEVSYSSTHGLIIKIGNSTGCISNDEIPMLQEFITNGLNGNLEEEEEEEEETEDDDAGEEDAEDGKEDEPDAGQFQMIRIAPAPVGNFAAFASELSKMM